MVFRLGVFWVELRWNYSWGKVEREKSSQFLFPLQGRKRNRIMTDTFMEYREEFESYRDDAMKDIKQMSHKKDKGM